MSSDLNELVRHAILAAREAGEYIASRWQQDIEVLQKEGGETIASQVFTEVDLNSQKIILRHLEPLCRQYDMGMLTEERTDDESRFEKDCFWAVDPLDGTLPFIEKQSGFSVSIGLVSQSGQALLGVIYDPVERVTYSAVSGQGMLRNGQEIAPLSQRGVLTCACDRSFLKRDYHDRTFAAVEEYAAQHGFDGVKLISHGGAAMNACWVLDYAPAIYVKVPKNAQGGGSIWDFAASACIVREAGGVVSDCFGQPLQLNSCESLFFNQSGVLYASDERLAAFCRGLVEEI